jgi:hypothetical protein
MRVEYLVEDSEFAWMPVTHYRTIQQAARDG